MTVSTAVADGIATVTIDNPPVNALSHAVRQGLRDALEETSGDDTVQAVVLICTGRTFIAGADVREFGLPPQEPLLPDVLSQIEAAPKPWIVAIHGTALGGGLETALVCHYRIADPQAKLGLPEVNLGLIPGAGGTVRLPRLIPADKALEIIAGGKPISAQAAREFGLVDEIAVGPLIDAAHAFARKVLSKPLPTPTAQRPVLHPSDPEHFDKVAKKIKAKARGQLSPVAACEAVQTALTLSAPEALVAERAIFVELRDGAQSKALRHVFFAERATARIERIKGVGSVPIVQVGIIGGGTMGAGIAAACLLAGLAVIMIERDDVAAKAGHDRVTGILNQSAKRGVLSDTIHADALERFSASTAYTDLSEANLVIEAVFEDMAVKRTVFEELDNVVRPDTILATNTSYLDVNALAAATQIPGRVIGLHFFSPAHIMKLLEIVVPDTASDVTLATAVAFAKKLSKIPALAGVCEGFIANRIMTAYRAEAEILLEDGALPWDVDRAMKAFGFPMGIFEMQDLAGLDIAWAKRKRLAATRDPNERYVDIGDKLCEAGHFGRKTGQGYYRYDESGKATPSPETEALILAESVRKGIARQSFEDAELLDRVLAALQAEADKVLAEGIARSAADIDVVMINAFGFPRWTGGPMFMRSA